jgi:hypothetical protein
MGLLRDIYEKGLIETLRGSKEYRKETAIEAQKKYGKEIALETQTVESLSRLKVQRGTVAIEA